MLELPNATMSPEKEENEERFAHKGADVLIDYQLTTSIFSLHHQSPTIISKLR